RRPRRLRPAVHLQSRSRRADARRRAARAMGPPHLLYGRARRLCRLSRSFRLAASINGDNSMTQSRPVVTRGGTEDERTAQSGDCVRVSGVSPQHTPATKIWFGRVSNEPGHRSPPHHHAEAETGGYVLKGRGRIYFGDGYKEYVDMSEGDFVFVPPFMPHVEVNMSTTDELVWLTARTPDNLVVNLPDIDDSELEGYRRR